ncbi:MAG: zinc ABC transporter substrate-binding protein [Thaumarchaeota archaeon]|nr:zinc ABC transporter substrate-binding protein [Nitrososphaerota archaeon]
MFNQTRIAIISIAVIIPLSSFAVLNSSQSIILDEPKINEQKVVAIASFFPLYEFTKEIGREKVDVTLLVPSGVEPHDWEPTIKNLQLMQQADVIIINGIGFENWIDNIDSVNSDVKVVDTSIGISILESDPHIWLNPVMAQKQVENIVDSLSKVDPLNEKYYKQNGISYIKKLEELDNKISYELSSCKKDFISFHDAFSYFANQYDLNQHTVLKSNEPHEEPTSKSLENIINLARDLDSNVIFTEEAVDKRASQVIANEIGGKVLTLSPLEVGDSQTDYIKKMEENLLHLKEALCN